MVSTTGLSMQTSQLDGWIPIRVNWEDKQAVVDWCYLGERALTEPFFDQSVQSCLRRPFNLLFRQQTPIDALAEQYAHAPGLRPTGFIFHTSRCGSTLAAQMLAALPRTVVLSEAPPIDSILRARFRVAGLTDEQRIAWLRWMVSALGQRRRGDEERLFIKFDAWSVLDLPLIQRAFPDTPWIFLYRNPVEVIVSQLKRRGAHMIPGVLESELFGMTHAEVITTRPEEYGARVLKKICEAALQPQARAGRFINYNQLPEAIWSSILDFFRVDSTAADRESLQRVAQVNAKNPAVDFSDDSEAKRTMATEMEQAMAELWLGTIYQRLEAARVAD
jgi:gluconate kinase